MSLQTDPRPSPWVWVRDAVSVRLQVWWITRWAALPRWGQALVVFVACQLVTAIILDRAARFTALDADHTGSVPYLKFVARWDSAWYRKIAQGGYPDAVPRDADGVAVENPWAFYPLYPLLCRAVMQVPGLGWPVAGWLVSVCCALAAAVVLRSLLDPLAGAALALWSVALLAAFPTAAVLQFPYTESLALLLLLAVLWCLNRGHYLWAAPVVLLLGLTRPVAVPVAAVVVVHLVVRLRDREAIPAARGGAMITLLAAAGVAAVEWPVLAALRTSDATAYTDSMAAWRSGRSFHPLEPWFEALDRYLGLGVVVAAGLLIAALVALAWWLTRPRADVLGLDLRVWCGCYVGYLLLVLDPTTSLARYLLLLFPLGTLLAAASASPAYRRALLVASFVCQLVWIVTVWRVGSSPP